MSQDDIERYHAAAHGMQTGVEFSKDKTDQEPKHLRVGINCAMSDQGGLVTLLIEKGVFTRDEYEKAVADAMERERDAMQQRINAEYPVGARIRLV